MMLQIIVLSLSIFLASVQAEDAPVLGGLKRIEKGSKTWEMANNLAEFSLTHLETSSGTNEKLKLVKLTEAFSQVVAGTKYYLTFEVSNPKGDSKTCKVEVVEQPWLEKKEVTKASCEDKPLTV